MFAVLKEKKTMLTVRTHDIFQLKKISDLFWCHINSVNETKMEISLNHLEIGFTINASHFPMNLAA